jgi:hypothetical protein
LVGKPWCIPSPTAPLHPAGTAHAHKGTSLRARATAPWTAPGSVETRPQKRLQNSAGWTAKVGERQKPQLTHTRQQEQSQARCGGPGWLLLSLTCVGVTAASSLLDSSSLLSESSEASALTGAPVGSLFPGCAEVAPGPEAALPWRPFPTDFPWNNDLKRVSQGPREL